MCRREAEMITSASANNVKSVLKRKCTSPDSSHYSTNPLLNQRSVPKRQFRFRSSESHLSRVISRINCAETGGQGAQLSFLVVIIISFPSMQPSVPPQHQRSFDLKAIQTMRPLALVGPFTFHSSPYALRCCRLSFPPS